MHQQDGLGRPNPSSPHMVPLGFKPPPGWSPRSFGTVTSTNSGFRGTEPNARGFIEEEKRASAKDLTTQMNPSAPPPPPPPKPATAQAPTTRAGKGPNTTTAATSQACHGSSSTTKACQGSSSTTKACHSSPSTIKAYHGSKGPAAGGERPCRRRGKALRRSLRPSRGTKQSKTGHLQAHASKPVQTQEKCSELADQRDCREPCTAPPEGGPQEAARRHSRLLLCLGVRLRLHLLQELGEDQSFHGAKPTSQMLIWAFGFFLHGATLTSHMPILACGFFVHRASPTIHMPIPACGFFVHRAMPTHIPIWACGFCFHGLKPTSQMPIGASSKVRR